MLIGFQLLSWRRHQGLSQAQFAEKIGLHRPYLSRLERDEIDPSLSLVRKCAAALEISVGSLLEQAPPKESLTRGQLDNLARGALKPKEGSSRVRNLSRALQGRRMALGLYRPRKKKTIKGPKGLDALRRLKADLGEKQWNALLRRIEKHASYLGQ